jgi:hypothetical protein
MVTNAKRLALTSNRATLLSLSRSPKRFVVLPLLPTFFHRPFDRALGSFEERQVRFTLARLPASVGRRWSRAIAAMISAG